MINVNNKIKSRYNVLSLVSGIIKRRAISTYVHINGLLICYMCILVYYKEKIIEV